jgi:hypothetical protein
MPEQLDILPPPRFLGLDIDEKSVKLVEIQDTPQGMELTKFATENVAGELPRGKPRGILCSLRLSL